MNLLRVFASLKGLMSSSQNSNYSQWYNYFLSERLAIENSIPRYVLQNKHIQHVQLLVNREALLNELPKNAVCAEIGVNKGDFSSRIIHLTSPRKLHLIDAWGDASRYHDGLRDQVLNRFRGEIEKGLVEVNLGYSTQVLKEFPDQYFDWVYLDTDHTYKVTSEELSLLKDKVKSNGIIAGHDFIIGNWGGDCRYGVIEAVYELCVCDDWELLYQTADISEMPSFAIRKLSKDVN